MPAAKQGRQRGQKSDMLTAHEVLALLCQTCMRLEKWEEAASAMMEKIALSPRGINRKSGLVLDDISSLVTILYAKKDYGQGHLYARQLLRGYRKLGTSGEDSVERTLILLVEICKASGNSGEEEAYSIMLEGILEKTATEAEIQTIDEEDEEVTEPSQVGELTEPKISAENLPQLNVERKPENLEVSIPKLTPPSEPPSSHDSATNSSLPVVRRIQLEDKVVRPIAEHTPKTHGEPSVEALIQSSYARLKKRQVQPKKNS